MKKYLLLIGFAMITALVISGCLLTLQKTFVEDVNIGSTTNDTAARYWVDLYTNEDYADNIDKIKSVDDVSFVAKIFNHGATANKAELFVSLDSIPADVDSIEAQATRVFVSPSIAAGDSLLITWSNGFNYVENVSVLKDYVMNEGRFWVYGIADASTFSDSIKAQIVVTVTAGN
jgi:hypothetical protein